MCGTSSALATKLGKITELIFARQVATQCSHKFGLVVCLCMGILNYIAFKIPAQNLTNYIYIYILLCWKMYRQKTGFLDWGYFSMEQPGILPKITIWQQQTNIDRKFVVCVCECRVAPVNVDVYVRCGVQCLRWMLKLDDICVIHHTSLLISYCSLRRISSTST